MPDDKLLLCRVCGRAIGNERMATASMDSPICSSCEQLEQIILSNRELVVKILENMERRTAGTARAQTE